MKNLINHHPMFQKVWENLVLLVTLGLAVHLILPQITSFENSFWLPGLAGFPVAGYLQRFRMNRNEKNI